MTPGPAVPTYDLSQAGHAHFLGAGWSGTEFAGTWSIDDESLLILPTPWQDVDCRLLLRMSPYLPPDRPPPTLQLFANGWHFGTVTPWRSGFCVHPIDVSRHAYTNRPALCIVLKHPAAASPMTLEGGTDDRRLAFLVSEVRLQPLTEEYLGRLEALRAAIKSPLARSQEPPAAARAPEDVELVSAFESLGTNCELGFVQRMAGAEPLGLMRFAGLPPDKLIQGLEDGFARIATEGRHRVGLIPHLPDEGYVGYDDTYNLTYHTYLKPAEVEAADLIRTEAERLPYLARRIVEDLEDGEKIFVVKDDDGLHLDDVLRIEAALRRRGPGVLLWVEGAEPGYPPGSVEVLRPGLMRGRVDRFANLTLGIHDVSLPIWLMMLRNALSLRSRARLA